VALRTTVQDREWDKFTLDDDGLTAVRTKTTGTLTGTIRPSGLNIGGRVSEVTINSASWTALPATPLTDRNALAIQNVSGQDIKINFDSGVAGFVGMVIGDGSERTYDITDDIIIYAKSSSGSAVLNIEEIA
jgi:hypothetical protein